MGGEFVWRRTRGRKAKVAPERCNIFQPLSQTKLNGTANYHLFKNVTSRKKLIAAGPETNYFSIEGEKIVISSEAEVKLILYNLFDADCLCLGAGI